MLKYIESLFICLPAFVLIFVYLIGAYNITGVIKEDSKYADFVITFLADLAKEDAIFDANTNWNFIPVIG